MQLYTVEFFERDGRKRIECARYANAKVARTRIRARGGLPARVSLCRPLSRHRRLRFAVPPIEVAAILDQLSMQLEAGYPLDEALYRLLENAPKGNRRLLLQELALRVSSDGAVADAFREFPRLFPDHFCQMIEVGHQGGRLPEVFASLGAHLARQDSLRASVQRALNYPLLALGLVGAVVGFLLVAVVPLFRTVFQELNAEMPMLTRGCLWLSDRIRDPVFWLLCGGAVISGGVLISSSPAVRLALRRLWETVPGVSGLVRLAAWARFCGNLQTLYRAGIALQRALEICAQNTGARRCDKVMARVAQRVQQGATMGEAMCGERTVPELLVSSILVGERTNRLEETLERMRLYFERRAQERAALALQWLEPLLTLGLGLLVGLVAVSLFYPLIRLSMSIRL